MFWKKEKQINIKTYDYYVLSGDVQDGFWLNLHYSENEEDPFFLDICKEIILKVLSNKATILSFEILKDQEEVTIINHLEGKDCSNNNYILKEDQITIKKKALDYRNLTFGFMDITVAMLLFLPVFGQVVDGVVQNVSLIEITHISAYLKVIYFSIIALSTVVGVLTLALQNCEYMLWLKTKNRLSLLVSMLASP